MRDIGGVRRSTPFLFMWISVIGGIANAADPLFAPLTPFFREHCFSCHAGAAHEGGVDFEKLDTDLRNPELVAKWVRVFDRISRGEMPPSQKPRPGVAEIKLLVDRLGAILTEADGSQRHSRLRRLNRVEYENTVRDLFGIRVDLKDLLPADPKSQGFDTVGDVLSISAEQLEVYLQATDQILDQVFGTDVEPARTQVRIPLGEDEFASKGIGRYFVKTEDNSLVTFQDHFSPSVFFSGRAKAPGTFRMRIQAKTYQSRHRLVMAVYGGDVVTGRGPTHLVGYYDIPPGDEWTSIEFEDYLEKNGCFKMVPYRLNTPVSGPGRLKGPGLMIGEVSVEGPVEAWPPTSRARLLGNIEPGSADVEDARRILLRLLPRAFRRRIQSHEIDPFLNLTKDALATGRPFLDALRLGLKGVLCAPGFLLREEWLLSGQSVRITNEALASRMSYFLWSSMPDDELTDRVSSAEQVTPDLLREQVERMLRDPKSDRFVENFTGQWLGLRDINFTEPDARLYPEFDEMLRYSMVEETHRFFREILEHNEPLLDFVDSNWGILNERLAVHYSIPGVVGQGFRRVAIPINGVRGGVLTQASVLKITANGTNTSPVVRGNWVLTNILGEPSPPPPPNVSGIEPDIRSATSIRDRLAKHRNIAACAVCHDRIDPPGFALESFDAIGGFRKAYRTIGVGLQVNLSINGKKVEFRNGPAVDSSGEFPDGRKFLDIREFKSLLRQDETRLAKCLTEKLLVYALGRPLTFSDRGTVKSIVQKLAAQKYGFRSLIQEVVLSPAFGER
jgi:Protein of unknown function (DUF1592)/Protein of unknown function (DUF1588)/Protein of unknown function (DUF1587)/Protein of unknown function (DUF1585)/Protein of unknown function (DUF1595)/Planctomycete cytochrome C